MRQRSSTKTGFATSLVLAGLLSGCQALNDMEAEQYRQQCATLGIEPGTPHFEQCMLQQQALNEDETERSLDRMQRDEASSHKK
ncbi:hypothetical protein CAP48_07505 [Advenella sp. S44]|uniref:hypothetical protein n=1 Tax=Advenella sp. S44 TaxID=1982755 RepID=UPI000C2AB796|nr:hypothetical protein [Advenella sp. S44]PJX25870.1 hypothetical protein CAP48_07505 [Advenella sp. S44]